MEKGLETGKVGVGRLTNLGLLSCHPILIVTEQDPLGPPLDRSPPCLLPASCL